MTEQHTIVIDNGTGFCKVGISNQEVPRAYIPSIVGKPKLPSIMLGMDQKQSYIGKEAESRKGVLNIKNPIINGNIQNWQDMSKIWHHAYYNELKINPQQHPCLITQPPKNPKSIRQKLTQVMFQTFNVPSLYLAISSVLSLYSTGRTTGIVLDSGQGVTHAVPIFQGNAIPEAIQRQNYAGWNLTQRINQQMTDFGINFHFPTDYQIFNQIKQKNCYVALDYEEQLKKIKADKKNQTNYVLPDGETISLGQTKIRCSEILFSPQKFNKQMFPLQELIYQSIKHCDIDLRKQLYSNIILSGGSTMFKGLPERLNKQLLNYISLESKINIIAPVQRKLLTWVGGAILSSLGTSLDMWITKGQFYQSGSSIVNRKCI